MKVTKYRGILRILFYVAMVSVLWSCNSSNDNSANNSDSTGNELVWNQGNWNESEWQ